MGEVWMDDGKREVKGRGSSAKRDDTQGGEGKMKSCRENCVWQKTLSQGFTSIYVLQQMGGKGKRSDCAKLKKTTEKVGRKDNYVGGC